MIATGTPLRLWWAVPLAVGGGLLGVLAFPTFDVWPLAVVAVAALSVAVHRQRARTGALLGLGWGLGFFVPLLSWTGIYVGPAPWLILAAAEAAYVALLGAALPLLQRLRWGPLWVACAWVADEALRSRWPFGGFPWGRLAFSQSGSPLRWFAAVGGAPLVSAAVALAGAALGALALGLVPGLADAPGWARVRAAVGRAAVVAAVPVLALALTPVLAPPPAASERHAVVALVQGDVPRQGLVMEDRAREVLDNHVQATLELAARITAGQVPRPDLVVWPENASDVDPYTDPQAAAAIAGAADAVRAPILVGAIVDDGPDHVLNRALVWQPGTTAAPTAPGSTYDKRHPVPFAEYIPWRTLAGWVSDKVSLVARDMAPGGGDGLLTTGPFPIGDAICFEVAYDSLVRSSVRAGAQLLVVQTNNATFGYTAETYQQLAMSRLRAVETGRTVLPVSTTGVSAVIGADGRIVQRSGDLFTRSVLVADVPLRTSLTPAVRVGPWPEWAMTAVALVALAVGVGRGVTARRRRGPGDTGGSDGPDVGAPRPASPTARTRATTGASQ